jgi:UrcA family protein
MPTPEEICMRANTVVLTVRPFICAAAAACALAAGQVVADDHDVTVAIHVNSQGLDLTKPAGAQQFYARLAHAAKVACSHGERVDLVPVPDPTACAAKALGSAVRSANQPLLTQAYLGTHTLQEAATYAITLPAQVATK